MDAFLKIAKEKFASKKLGSIFFDVNVKKEIVQITSRSIRNMQIDEKGIN